MTPLSNNFESFFFDFPSLIPWKASQLTFPLADIKFLLVLIDGPKLFNIKLLHLFNQSAVSKSVSSFKVRINSKITPNLLFTIVALSAGGKAEPRIK